jgi:hypothetical protein
VMWIHHLVAELELDVFDLTGYLEVVCQRCFFSCLYGNGCPPSLRPTIMVGS